MTDERFIIGENGIPRPSPALPEDPPEQEPEQFRSDSFARTVTSYLLGQMSEEESDRFEDECLAQKTWPSQVKLVEEDLIDAYLQGELQPEQYRLFEQNYLTTEARQERVKVAAMLLRRACGPDVIVRSPADARSNETWAERLQAFWRRRGLHAAAALATLLVVVTVSWLYLSRVRPPRAVATLTLTSSVNNRSEGAQAGSIKLPPDADALRVFLTLPERATPAPRYQAELDSEDGETTTLAVEVQDGRAVSVLIPTSLLPRGRYVVTLFAVRNDGTEQPAYGTYFFNVE